MLSPSGIVVLSALLYFIIPRTGYLSMFKMVLFRNTRLRRWVLYVVNKNITYYCFYFSQSIIVYHSL
uniref:Uncharacterized protein n=1 Tax=Siphoviridae sp. ctg0K17 TaxID=2825600 RepID=A0A8S5PUZ7_9CAUD|nr:MAG TPA: hypothetical protein [Siphoviridae sp. ctg0K17]